MNQIKIKYAKLHTSFFLAGTNFKDTLTADGKTGIELIYLREHKELIVSFKGQYALLPDSNVASMSIANPADLELEGFAAPLIIVPEPKIITNTTSPQVAGISSAQVSDPTRDVVFRNGPGNVRN